MRFTSLFSFGAALVCAVFLVACGGGGSTPTAGGSLTGGSLNGSHAAGNQGPGTHLTMVIDRSPQRAHTRSHARGAKARREPKYISTGAGGMQITVSGTGVASQAVYADVRQSPLSPLCTMNGSTETCVITIPTVAANEQVTVLETDNAPQNPNAGYGTGFASGTNILGALNAGETLQLGAQNALNLSVGWVAALFYDCMGDFTPPGTVPQYSNANFGFDSTNGGNLLAGSRLVVTGGVPSSGSIQFNICDVDEDYQDYATTVSPFVDVNGSPTPITVTSNSSAVSVLAYPNTSTTAAPTTAYAATTTLPNDSYYWQNTWGVVGVQTTAAFSSPATVTLNNNLTALDSFLSSPSSYANTMTYTVVPITVSPMVATVAAAGGTATVTGSDNGAEGGMDATSSFANEGFPGDDNCNTSGGTTLATVSAGSLNTTSWTQPFTITGNSNGTGTCTFYIYDLNAGTVSQAVTVTVN